MYDIAPNKEVCTEPIYYLKSVKKPGITDLEWWKKNKKKFPMLSKFALQFLCVPLTSAAIERAFSHAGVVISKKRTHQKEAATNAKIKSKIKKNCTKLLEFSPNCCCNVVTKYEPRKNKKDLSDKQGDPIPVVNIHINFIQMNYYCTL